jgi:hypothetical protein
MSADKSIDPLQGLDGFAVWAWMDNYCRVNPLHEVANRAESFIYQRRGAASPTAASCCQGRRRGLRALGTRESGESGSILQEAAPGSAAMGM